MQFLPQCQMALGAVQAIKAAGYKPNEDILVIGIDGEMDAFKSVIAGEMVGNGSQQSDVWTDHI